VESHYKGTARTKEMAVSALTGILQRGEDTVDGIVAKHDRDFTKALEAAMKATKDFYL
jgi:hypothetical protein